MYLIGEKQNFIFPIYLAHLSFCFLLIVTEVIWSVEIIDHSL